MERAAGCHDFLYVMGRMQVFILLMPMQIRDIDLDTLEKVTSIIAFGDIEAEDTRHLTELNFIKV